MRDMWKLVGIVVFSIAFGMILTVLISNRLASLIVAIILLLVSYNVIFCEKQDSRGNVPVKRVQKKTVCKFIMNSGSLIFVLTNTAEDKSQNILPDYTLSTLPDFRQLVHTCNFLDAPLTLHFTLLTFEFQIRLDLLWEWLTLFPK